VDQLPPHPAENRAERFEAFHPSPLSPKTADKRLTKIKLIKHIRQKHETTKSQEKNHEKDADEFGRIVIDSSCVTEKESLVLNGHHKVTMYDVTGRVPPNVSRCRRKALQNRGKQSRFASRRIFAAVLLHPPILVEGYHGSFVIMQNLAKDSPKEKMSTK